MVLSIGLGSVSHGCSRCVARNRLPSPKPSHPVSLGSGRGAADPCVVVLSSEASLLMAVLYPCELLQLTEVFTLVGDEATQSVHALVVGAW